MSLLRRLITALLLVASPASAQTPAPLRIEAPFARPMPTAANPGVAYLTIRNPRGEADQLLRAETPVAGRVELHTHINDGGIMRMREVPVIEVPARGIAELKPGGLHLMLMEPKRQLREGEVFPLTLHFRNAGAVTIQVPVRRGGAHEHRH